jgi:hypothetical protein
MKRVSLSLERSPYLWLLLVLGFSALILLGVLAITGPAGATAAAPAAQNPAPAPDEDLTTVMSHTVFLPLVYGGYFWQPPSSHMGVQMYPNHMEQAAIDKAVLSGARWVRFPMTWRVFEPENTTPDNYSWWPPLDSFLAELSANNIDVILTFGGNPDWAATYANGHIDRTSLSEVAQAVQAAVARYSAPPYNVKYWEFYNEPDNGSAVYAADGWGYWGKWPGEYAALLQAVYGPIKAVDPDAQVLFGGIAYDNWETMDPPGPFIENFLDGVLQAGGGDYFDIMNFHYYPGFDWHWAPYGQGIIGKVNYLRDKLAQYNVSKPFICTETSKWSEGYGSTPEIQARYVPQVYARSKAADLQAAIWLKLIDSDSLTSWKYGLLNPDLTPKLAYYAYQVASQQLAPFHYVRTWTDGETGSPEIEAYELVDSDGGTSILAAWTNDDLQHPLSVPTLELIRVGKYGGQTVLHDPDDGTVDGRVTLTLDPDPVYLRWTP